MSDMILNMFLFLEVSFNSVLVVENLEGSKFLNDQKPNTVMFDVLFKN